jgi:plastocyanin
MNHITLFGLATFALAVAGVAAEAIACDVEADQSAALSAMQVAAASATKAATIKVFQFQPTAIEVRAGMTVTWTNEDNIDHTVTSGTPETPVGNFDSGGFGRGRSFSAIFHTPGEYAYFCARHKSMRGTVKVLPAE